MVTDDRGNLTDNFADSGVLDRALTQGSGTPMLFRPTREQKIQ
jgi:hypothetical protein